MQAFGSNGTVLVSKTIEGLGDNTVQEEELPDTEGELISTVRVTFESSAAVTKVKFCSTQQTVTSRPVDDAESGSDDYGTERRPVDLGIRFNKVGEVVGSAGAQMLLPKDYPIDAATAEWLRLSESVSVILEEDCDECKYSFSELLASIGGVPWHPESNPNAPFWEEMREVVDVQKARRADIDSRDIMSMPDSWDGLNLEEIAEAVHDEYPGENQAIFIERLLAEGAEMDTTIIPSRSRSDFLRKPVLLAQLNTWSVAVVGPHNFGMKYVGGRARPEEVAIIIAEDKIGVAEGVPDDIVQDIKDMNLNQMEDFAAYPEGSPKHPSWPAMHSAASSASLWLPVVMSLTPNQLCQVRLVDYGVSYGRTVAGVHYSSDNIAGLNLGAELVARQLPQFLENMYQSDPGRVETKLEQFIVEWDTFEDTDCFKSGRNP